MKDTLGSIEVSLEGEQLTYTISSIFDLEDLGKKKMTWFTIKKMWPNDSDIIKSWDNDEYLYNTFYLGVIEPWALRNEVSEPSEFSYFLKIHNVHIQDLKSLNYLFIKAIELGMFDEVINKKDDKKD